MSVERHNDGDVALNDALVAEKVGDDVVPVPPPHNEGGDDTHHDDGSSSSDSDDDDSASNPDGGDQQNNNNTADEDDTDLLLGIDLGGGGGDAEEGGAVATNEDNGDLSVKKEKKSKDKKSKKDKDKKSKKDKHKDKKGKDKKSKKDKHKKDKHGKRDRDLDGMEKYVRDAADNGVERRRRRKERTTGPTDDGDRQDGGGNNGDDRQYTKRGTSTVELKHLQSLLEASLIPTAMDNGEMAHDVNAIHEVLVELASLEVSYENLATTRIGTTVGKLLAAEYHNLMQAPFANAILRYWFLRLEEHRRKQLVRVDELENASVASQYDAREAPEEMAILNRIGVDIEKMFTLDELDAAGVVDASHIAAELSNLLTLDEDVRELVLNRLRAPDNKALRVKLLKGEVQATELVNHPDVVGVSETQRRRDFEQEEKYLHNRTL